MSTTTPSTLEKIGGELLDEATTLLQIYETPILAQADALLKTGITNVAGALSTAISSKIPVVGATLAGIITTALTGLDTSAENALKTGYDFVVAALKTEAAKLGG